MPYKKTILTIFQVAILLIFTKILNASEPTEESPFERLPGDFRRAMTLAIFEKNDWLRFSETCWTYRQDFFVTVVAEIQKDRHAHQRYFNKDSLKQYAIFSDILEAFREGDPHVVSVIAQLFPAMSSKHLHQAFKIQSQRQDIIPTEQACALYHLAHLRIVQRTNEGCLKLIWAYDSLRQLCCFDSSLPDDLKRQGIYYMAKIQAEHEPKARFQNWNPQFSWGEVFTILTMATFSDPCPEMVERNFLTAALRIEGKVGHDCMTKENAARSFFHCWAEFSSVIGSETLSINKRIKALQLKFDFLMRTRDAFTPFTLIISTMQHAWPAVLAEFRLLLAPHLPLPLRVRSDLREKKLTLLSYSLENLMSPYLVAKDLLEEFLEEGEVDRSNLTLEHKAETMMTQMIDRIASTIYAQPDSALAVLRLFLVKYTPTCFLSTHVRKYAKTDALESLIKAIEPFTLKRVYHSSPSLARTLPLMDQYVSRRAICDLLVEPEILAVMEEIDSHDAWRDYQIRNRFCKWLIGNHESESFLEDDTQRKRQRLGDKPHSSSDEVEKDEIEEDEKEVIPTLFLQLSGSYPSMGTPSTQPLDYDDY